MNNVSSVGFKRSVDGERKYAWSEAERAYYYARGEKPKLTVGKDLDSFALNEDKRILLSTKGFKYEIDGNVGYEVISSDHIPEIKTDSPIDLRIPVWGVIREGSLTEDEIRRHKDWFIRAIGEFNLPDSSREKLLESYRKLFTNYIKSCKTVAPSSRLDMIVELAQYELKP